MKCNCTAGPTVQGGAAIVEFTITLPLLLLMMLATAELGRTLSQYNTLTKCIRDAARYVASRASTGTTRIISITPPVRTAARNLAVTGNIFGAGDPLLPGLTVNDIVIADAGNGYVSVSATYLYRPMIGATLPTFGIGDPIPLAIPLRSTIIMRAL